MDPLAELKDIHLPDAISWWPLAYGWWIAITMILLVIIFSLITFIKHRKLTASKRMALTQLKILEHPTPSDIISLLKSVAIHYMPRQSIASLYGANLQKFLCQCLPAKKQQKFMTLCDTNFDNLYQGNIDNQNRITMINAAQYWIEHAIPLPKTIKNQGE